MRNRPWASSRETPRVVCVRSFVPNEKKSAFGPCSQLDQPLQLGRERDEWVHDLDDRLDARRALDRVGGAHDRPDLHLVDLGPFEPEAAAARPEHRVRLTQSHDPLAHCPVLHLGGVGQELVQRRVEQPDRDGQARHCREDPLEVGLLHRQELRERGRLVDVG